MIRKPGAADRYGFLGEKQKMPAFGPEQVSDNDVNMVIRYLRGDYPRPAADSSPGPGSPATHTAPGGGDEMTDGRRAARRTESAQATARLAVDMPARLSIWLAPECRSAASSPTNAYLSSRFVGSARGVEKSRVFPGFSLNSARGRR